MKKRTPRTKAWLAVLLLSAGILTGCAGSVTPGTVTTEKPTSTEAPTDDTDSGTVVDDETRYAPEKKTFDTEYILATDNAEMWGIRHYTAREGDVTGTDTVNYALWVRQTLLESEYGVTMKLKTESQLYDQVNLVSNSGEFYADATFLTGTQLMKVAAKGYVYNLLNMPELNLEAPYWNQRMQSEFLIGDKLFGIDGDHDMTEEMITMSVLLNRGVYDSISGLSDTYGDPYDLVRSGGWTQEVMLKMAHEFTSDLTGDGMDTTDHWGIVGEAQTAYYFYLGSGFHVITNQEGKLVFGTDDQSAMETFKGILSTTMEMVKNPDLLIAERDIKGGNHWKVASDIFSENRALFRTTSLSTILSNGLSNKGNLRFGLLPIPKYFADQDGYYSWVTADSSRPLAILTSVPDRSRTAQITEIMAYHSRYGTDNLYNAFYDKMRFMKICQSAEDIAMLELIYANKTYDVENAIQVVDLRNMVMDMSKRGDISTLSSELTSRFDKAKNKLVELVTDINKNYRG